MTSGAVLGLYKNLRMSLRLLVSGSACREESVEFLKNSEEFLRIFSVPS
jgi:hypothetical protein